jgi:hypothetical protein
LSHFSPSLSTFSTIITESSLIIHCWLPGCITDSALPPYPLIFSVIRTRQLLWRHLGTP